MPLRLCSREPSQHQSRRSGEVQGSLAPLKDMVAEELRRPEGSSHQKAVLEVGRGREHRVAWSLVQSLEGTPYPAAAAVAAGTSGPSSPFSSCRS